MRVAVIGGRSRADYLVGMLANEGHGVVAVNNDRAYCEYLSNRHDVRVFCGDGTKARVLEGAGIDGFDAVVALTGRDVDNFAICQLAKHCFDVPLQLCAVANPENIGVFRRLGVSAAISGTHALASAIQDSMSDGIAASQPRLRPAKGLFERMPNEPPLRGVAGSSWRKPGKT